MAPRSSVQTSAKETQKTAHTARENSGHQESALFLFLFLDEDDDDDVDDL